MVYGATLLLASTNFNTLTI